MSIERIHCLCQALVVCDCPGHSACRGAWPCYILSAVPCGSICICSTFGSHTLTYIGEYQKLYHNVGKTSPHPIDSFDNVMMCLTCKLRSQADANASPAPFPGIWSAAHRHQAVFRFFANNTCVHPLTPHPSEFTKHSSWRIQSCSQYTSAGKVQAPGLCFTHLC
jgi:hypothetical protein